MLYIGRLQPAGQVELEGLRRELAQIGATCYS